MSMEMPYNPGFGVAYNKPLARFLPPISTGVISSWLRSNCEPNAIVIDPFGASPQLVVEAARAGYQVVVAANNPINRVLIELEADPPTESELQHVIADLAVSKRGDERLEPHLRSLYNSECHQCGNVVEAQGFIWDREKDIPTGKIYRCPACGVQGEFPTSDADIYQAQQHAQSKLHRARALERVASLNDPNRNHVEEALEVYLPRAVYALFNLINKLDALDYSLPAHRILAALLLCVCDQANNLWSYPSIRARPKQLITPTRFRENNIWLALENAVKLIISDAPSVPIVTWPDLPPNEGGISIFEGRLKDLIPQLADLPFSAIICALPRQNQAFWTLSALWAGWLWGREAIGPFSVVLRRKRYDWNWHATALHAAWETLVPVLKPGLPCFGLIGEAESGFLSAAILSAALAGLALTGMALRGPEAQAQLLWHPIHVPRTHSLAPFNILVSQVARAGHQHLYTRGEPSDYLNLHTQGLATLAHHIERLPQADPKTNFLASPGEAVTTSNNIFNEAFTYREGYLRLAGSEKSLDVGLWWLRSPQTEQLTSPLADRVERLVVEHLLKNPQTTYYSLETALGVKFPGLLMPSSQMVQECLKSYGEQASPGTWVLRVEDKPQNRRDNIAEISAILVSLGERFGWQVAGKEPVQWINPDGSLCYSFFIIASAILSEILNNPQYSPTRSFIVIPGGRASLILFKQNQNPLLAQATSQGWRFLKFRQVFQLAKQTILSRENLEDQWTLDPLTGDSPQMRLL